jgi:hypothetical protein
MWERRDVYRVLVGNPEGKRPLRRRKDMWEDNIQICWNVPPSLWGLLTRSLEGSCSFFFKVKQRIIIAVRKIQGILRKSGRWSVQEDCGRLYFMDCFTLKMEANRFFETSRNINPMHPRRRSSSAAPL